MKRKEEEGKGKGKGKRKGKTCLAREVGDLKVDDLLEVACVREDECDGGGLRCDD